jgi:large subunit ribosomal protein L14
MILVSSKLWCTDNTDIKQVRCINFLEDVRAHFSRIGRVIKAVAFMRDSKKSKHIKCTLNIHLITALIRKTRRKNGVFIRFDFNRCLTLSAEFKFLGSRVYGPISKELAFCNKNIYAYKKIFIYAPSIL